MGFHINLIHHKTSLPLVQEQSDASSWIFWRSIPIRSTDPCHRKDPQHYLFWFLTLEETEATDLLRAIGLQHGMGSPESLSSTCYFREKETEISQPRPPGPPVLTHWLSQPPLGMKLHFSITFIALTLVAPGLMSNHTGPTDSKGATQTTSVD